MNKSRPDIAVSAIKIVGVTKRFGFTNALKHIDLELAQGEFLAIFGPNGAGKTTLLKILATLTTPSSGHVSLLGYNLLQHGETIRRIIGVLSHQPFLTPTLTGRENLKFYGQMFGVNNLNARIDALLNDVGMLEYRDRLIENCSRGMQQRIGIARALLHEPRILLLDEPFTGLDPDGMAFLEHTLAQFVKEGKTVIMTCHDFVRGLECCTKTAILQHGKLVYYGKPSEQGEGLESLYQQYVRS